MYEDEPTWLEIVHMTNAAADFHSRADNPHIVATARLALYRIAYCGWRDLEDVLVSNTAGLSLAHTRLLRSDVVAHRKDATRDGTKLCRALKIPTYNNFELSYARLCWLHWKYLHGDIGLTRDDTIRIDANLCWSLVISEVKNELCSKIYVSNQTRHHAKGYADNFASLIENYRSVSHICRRELAK